MHSSSDVLQSQLKTAAILNGTTLMGDGTEATPLAVLGSADKILHTLNAAAAMQKHAKAEKDAGRPLVLPRHGRLAAIS